MIIAIKGNKQIKIDEKDINRYAANGFDVCERNDEGTRIVKHSESKTVSFAVYAALQAELEKAQAENAALQAELESKQSGKKKEG